jgi:prepilin-type N-terminal cleavage/methylation domain-containing protein
VRAFTLVELLVVIVIIGILIGLLVPAVGAVRRIAREGACRAVLSAIETGLESYKADGNLGGAYPPSRPDDHAGGTPRVKSPYTNKPRPISGAGLLVWALSGADLLGTPGFKTVGNWQYWARCTGNQYNNGPGDPTSPADLYAMNSATGQPAYPRSGPYVDASKLKVTQNENRTGSPDFVIPEERKVLGPNTPAREYPMYLDAFGYPVLYWRADPAGRILGDENVYTLTDNTKRGIYHYIDNAALLGGSVSYGEPELRLNKAKQAHALGWQNGTYTPQNPPPVGCFNRFIMNEAVQARLEPHRPDSYLLVTPGYDGRYGTADDITNFEHHGL